MKKYLLIFMAAIIFVNVSTANNVSAQTLKIIKAEVPFDFQIGDKTYPAGAYRLESIAARSDNLFQLRSFDRKKQQMLVTRSLFANRWQTPKLVFYRIGEAYYLTNIFMEDGNWGFSLPTPKRVREGRKLASTKIVEVPLNK
jgi:hypothetical protein